MRGRHARGFHGSRCGAWHILRDCWLEVDSPSLILAFNGHTIRGSLVWSRHPGLLRALGTLWDVLKMAIVLPPLGCDSSFRQSRALRVFWGATPTSVVRILDWVC